jgi:dienelactone hydrolase
VYANPERGRLVSFELMGTVVPADIANILVAFNIQDSSIQPTDTVDYYRILYRTPDYTGTRMVDASGLVALPRRSTPAPLGAYCHGTVLDHSGVPSQDGTEKFVGVVVASTGYVMALPDYIGLGTGTHFALHPYVHARSEATATVDALRAARHLAQQKGNALNGQVFLSGYSQGGHACAATQREIEQLHSVEFNLRATAPMSGPYDMTGLMVQTMLAEQPYPAPGYLPYVLLSYNMVYGMYASPDSFLRQPYATTLPPLYSGQYSLGQLEPQLNDTPIYMVRPDLVQQFVADSANHPFRRALVQNHLLDWRPNAPVRLIYCRMDSHINYQHALRARDAWTARGATHVEVYEASETLDHSDCALPALVAAKRWWDQHR